MSTYPKPDGASVPAKKRLQGAKEQTSNNTVIVGSFAGDSTAPTGPVRAHSLAEAALAVQPKLVWETPTLAFDDPLGAKRSGARTVSVVTCYGKSVQTDKQGKIVGRGNVLDDFTVRGTRMNTTLLQPSQQGSVIDNAPLLRLRMRREILERALATRRDPQLLAMLQDPKTRAELAAIAKERIAELEELRSSLDSPTVVD